MELVALDIETVCNVTGCKGFGDYKKCDHALSPWHGRITKIGAIKNGITKVCNTVYELNSWLRSIDNGYRFIGHNFKFDLLWLRIHGCEISLEKFAHCTQIMAYVLTEKIPDTWLEQYETQRKLQPGHHRKAGKHSLKTLAPYFLGIAPFWEVDDKADDEYVLKDAQYTFDLFPVLEKKLKERDEWDFYLRLLGWTKMLVTAEQRGIEIDLEALDAKEQELKQCEVELRAKLDKQWKVAHWAYRTKLSELLIEKYNEMAKRIGKKSVFDSEKHHKLHMTARLKLPVKVDYDSPKQMSWLLRDYLGYNITSLEGDETTGREVLERLANEGKEDVRVFLEWRQVQKLLTAFIPTYKDLQTDGVLHPVFNPTNTRTGRTSSERPNLQQVPPDLRGLFKARSGYKFISYDAAAIEAKLIALYSQDPELNRIVESGSSLHDVNTRTFFGLTEDSDIKRDYPIHRQATKNIGFALFYGAGSNRLRVTFANKGFHLTDSQCREILGRFKEKYKTAIQYHKDIAKYFESGKKMNNLLGRPVAIENPDEAYMKSFNSVIQGSASDLNLEGAYRAWNEMKKRGIDGTPLLFVHDMVLFEVKDEQIEAADEIITRNLTNFDLPIKLTVEGGTSATWEK